MGTSIIAAYPYHTRLYNAREGLGKKTVGEMLSIGCMPLSLYGACSHFGPLIAEPKSVG